MYIPAQFVTNNKYCKIRGNRPNKESNAIENTFISAKLSNCFWSKPNLVLEINSQSLINFPT